MPTIAYLTNLFPTPFEPYVRDEIAELRRRGIEVLPCSIRRQSGLEGDLKLLAAETLYLLPLKPLLLLQAAWLCVSEFGRLQDLLYRLLLQGSEGPGKRARALIHTWLGACLALLLANKNIHHIHVHHGYFGSWVAMVAARLLGIGFSMTLHGSDLLLHPAYLDTKLHQCNLCVTISSFNRQNILMNYPQCDPNKIVVRRMGVDCCQPKPEARRRPLDDSIFVMLSVGRLHPVKDHEFLLRSCRLLKDRGLPFVCWIAGDGEERPSLEKMIVCLGLVGEVRLLGQVPHHELGDYYEAADLVVLTSRSEGIPLVLMEAMAQSALVLAPAITGIPELVVDGETGFLYQPGVPKDFASRVEWIHQTKADLEAVRQAAREHVVKHFDRETNLAASCDSLLLHLGASHSQFIPKPHGGCVHENPVLQ